MKRRYTVWQEGEWVKMDRKNNRLMCCGCSIVHDLDVKVEENKGKHDVFMRLKRNERATAAARRGKAKTVVVTE